VAWERVKNPNLRYNPQQVSHHVSSDFCDVTPWHAKFQLFLGSPKLNAQKIQNLQVVQKW